MENNEQKLFNILLIFLSKREGRPITSPADMLELASFLDSRDVGKKNKECSCEQALKALPRPCYFVILNDNQRFESFDRVAVVNISPDIIYENGEWTVHYDFGPAFEEVVYASAGYSTEEERLAQKEAAERRCEQIKRMFGLDKEGGEE